MNNINRYGIAHLNIESDFDKSGEFILNIMKNKIAGYDRYISENLCFNKEISGYETIIKTIKET